MQRLMIEVLLPSEQADTAQARAHELVTRQGWVLESVNMEAVGWDEGLEILREALGETRNVALGELAREGDTIHISADDICT